MKITILYGYSILAPSLYKAEYSGTALAVLRKLAAFSDERHAIISEIKIKED